MESKNSRLKNFVLATLIHVFLRPKEIVSWHDGIICLWLNRQERKFWYLVKLSLQNLNVALCNSTEKKRSKRKYGEFTLYESVVSLIL